MKGYEMIVLVNGGIFIAVGVLLLSYGYGLRASGENCPGGNATTCQRTVDVGQTSLHIAPYLFAGGVLLLGAGWTLVAWRRWTRPPKPPEPDGGPGYP